jgi:hypothetical protein
VGGVPASKEISMPTLTITNRTASRLPVDSFIGILQPNQVRTVTLTANELEMATAVLVRLVNANQILFSVNPSASIVDNQAEPVLGGAKVLRGTGVPNSAVVGSVGDLFVRTDGGSSTTLYVKESGNGTNTGWVAK